VCSSETLSKNKIRYDETFKNVETIKVIIIIYGCTKQYVRIRAERLEDEFAPIVCKASEHLARDKRSPSSLFRDHSFRLKFRSFRDPENVPPDRIYSSTAERTGSRTTVFVTEQCTHPRPVSFLRTTITFDYVYNYFE